MNAKRVNKAISLGISALIVIALILILGFGLFLNDTFNTTSSTTNSMNPISLLTTTTHRSNTSQTTTITHISTCPPMCPTVTSQTSASSTTSNTASSAAQWLFQVSVLYSGSWKGWVANTSNGMGLVDHQYTNTTWTGTGNETVSFQAKIQFGVCSFVQKQDGSNANLTLVIYVSLGTALPPVRNSTVVAFGGVEVCDDGAL